MKNLMLSLIVLCYALNSPALSAAEQAPVVYTFGVVPQFETKRLHKIWKPILEQLEEKTGLKFELRGSPNIPEFEEELLAGHFDFAYMNPYHLVLANDKQGYLPLTRDHKKKLQGVLVVRKDSPIKDIKDLNNQLVAFPSPKALGASLLMRYELAELHQVQVKPVYVSTHDSVYLNVVLRQAAAGGGVGKTLSKQKDRVKDSLKVIYKTQEVNPHPIAVHPRIPAAVQQQVQKALLEMGQVPATQALLAKIPMPAMGTASIDDYDNLRKMDLMRFH